MCIRDRPHGALFIEVVDGSGNPLPSARIRFPVEAEVHSVNSESGMWMSTVLYAYDGTERYFQKGMEVEFEAFAPGFGHRRVTFEPSKRKKNLVRVELEPWTLAASPDATEPELRAVAAWSRWLEAAEAHQSDPSVESARTLNHVRSLTATAARDWLDATGSADARQLCWMTGTAQLCGT